MEIKSRGIVNEVYEKNLQALFWGYFNNKMILLLLMIERPDMQRSVRAVEKQKVFLHDLYHHFLPSAAPLKYHRAFRWLNLFLDRYPDVGAKAAARAVKMVSVIYEAFGFDLEKRLDGSGRTHDFFSNHKQRGGFSCSD